MPHCIYVIAISGITPAYFQLSELTDAMPYLAQQLVVAAEARLSLGFSALVFSDSMLLP